MSGKVHLCVPRERGTASWFGTACGNGSNKSTDRGDVTCLQCKATGAYKKGVDPRMTPEQEANHKRWVTLALVHGWNELAKKSQTLGEKVYCRMNRDAAERMYVEHGGKLFLTHEGPTVLELPVGPPTVEFRATDIEMMRAAVAEHDARSTHQRSAEEGR